MSSLYRNCTVQWEERSCTQGGQIKTKSNGLENLTRYICWWYWVLSSTFARNSTRIEWLQRGKWWVFKWYTYGVFKYFGITLSRMDVDESTIVCSIYSTTKENNNYTHYRLQVGAPAAAPSNHQWKCAQNSHWRHCKWTVNQWTVTAS